MFHRGPHLSTKTQLYPIAYKLQCWKPQTKQPVKQEHNPTHKKENEGFPGGAVIGTLPADAGDTGSSPGLGGSHMPWSSWACEPQLLSLRVWSLCSTAGGAAMVRGPHTMMKGGPHLPQLGGALARRRRPNTAIK